MLQLKSEDWNHLCIGYSAKTRRVVIMHNGHLEVDHTRPGMVKEVQSYFKSFDFPYF